LALGQAHQDAALGYLAFGTMAVYVLVIGCVYASNTMEARERIRTNLQALELDKAFVIHCKTNRFVEIEEEDDLPAV
jgi:hypothetical protein